MNEEEQNIEQQNKELAQEGEQKRGTLLLPSQDSLQFITTSQNLKPLEGEYLIVNDPNTVFSNLDPGDEYAIREFDDEDILLTVKMEQGFFGNSFEALAERKTVARHANLQRSRGKEHSERVLLVSEHHVSRNIDQSTDKSKKGRFGRFMRH